MQRIDEDRLMEAVDRLRDGLDPAAVFLYGSHAYGEPNDDSDVDLLVVLDDPQQPTYELEAKAYGLLAGLKLPAEIRVVSKQDFRERGEWVASIEREVHQRGVQLYGAA